VNAKHTPWAVIASPTDPEMYAVRGAYLVADNLPIEDAHKIAAAPDLLKALEALVNSFEKHRPKALWDAARDAIAKAKGAA
jgi:hypothetical protein